jgi:2-phosphoglycerate kinase
MTELSERLAHVFWIGGTGGAGKSAVASPLAARHGLQLYRFDDSGPRHAPRATTERHPEFVAFIAMTMDERWLLQAPEEMARNAIAGWAERFEFVLDDLLAMPATPRIVAEGIGLLPECVADEVVESRRAAFLVHTPAFLRDAGDVRQGLTSMTQRTADPARALENLMRRNELLADHIRTQALRRGLRVIDVDERLSLERAGAMVAEQFGLAAPP